MRPKLLAVLGLRHCSLPSDDSFIPHHSIESFQIIQLILFYPPPWFDHEEVVRLRYRDAEIYQEPALVVPRPNIHGVNAQFSHPLQIPQDLLDGFRGQWYIFTDQVFHDGSEWLSSRSWLQILAARPVPSFNVEILS